MSVEIKRLYWGNGKLKCETPHKNNKRHGIARIWDENGKLSHKTTWQNGKWHGISRGWYEDGKPKYKTYHLYNVLVSKEEWRKNQLIEKLSCLTK